MSELEIEYWYDHPKLKNYEFSNKGNVASLNYLGHGGRKVLKQQLSRDGYPTVHLSGGKRYRVHRLIWEAIKGEIPADYHVDHLDFNRCNNCIENLTIRPHSENEARLSEDGREKQIAGAKRSLSKAVVQIDLKTDEVIKEWGSAAEASRQLNICKSSICNCCKGFYHSAGGFGWRKRDE